MMASAAGSEARDSASTVDVAVVIVTCNGGDEVVECVRTVGASDPRPTEIVVVDNGSSDGSIAALRALEAEVPGLSIVELDDNLGPSAARNIGVAKSSASVIAFLDNDTIVAPDWLARALATMEQFGADCVQCKLVLRMDDSKLDSIGTLVGPFGFPRHLVRLGDADAPELQEPRRLFSVKSAGMVMTREAFEVCGGFDGDFFIYGEETDLCWRLHRSGRAVVYAPTSVVIHNAGGTRRFLPERSADLLYRGGTRNYILMVAKNTTTRRFLLDVGGQVLVWFGVAAYQAVRSERRSARLILRGIGEALRALPGVLRARRASGLPFVPIPDELRMPLTPRYIRRVVRAI